MINNKTSSSVRLSNVQKRYGDVLAIDNVSLDIRAGELVTLLGPSGCGKTTMLRMIAGLEDATSGDIFIGHQNVTHQAASYRNVAMVFQSYALFPHMTVLENVCYGLSVSSKMKKSEQKKVALQGLDMVGLAGFENRLPSELSGGQQQRVAVARAVVLEPDVLLFDEPLSNLDAKLRRHVRSEIRQIQQDLGLTAVYVTHDQEEAMAVSDQIVVMQAGVIAQMGSPSEIYEKPNSEFIADFIGDANVVNCRVLSCNNQNAIVELNGIQLSTQFKGSPSKRARLAVHPHDVSLTEARVENSFPGEVLNATYLGKHVEYDVRTDAGELFVVDHQTGTYFQRGTSVHVRIADDKPVLLPTA